MRETRFDTRAAFECAVYARARAFRFVSFQSRVSASAGGSRVGAGPTGVIDDGRRDDDDDDDVGTDVG